jgi:hypothetical protein
MLENLGLLFEKASCQQDEALLTLPTVAKCSEIKGKVYPRKGHEGPEGSRSIALLFL